MSLPIASEQLADLRHAAQLLIEGAGDQEGQLEAFVAAAEAELRQAEMSLSHAADDLDVDEIRLLLSAQVQRAATAAAAAGRLLAGAHRQHPAACRLPQHLAADSRPREERRKAVLDGIEATRLIKAGEATRAARVIAYTGSPSFNDSPTRTLFAAVLTTPAAPGAVLAAVQRVAGL